MSSYSPDLRIELIDSGAQAGTWGTTTNNTFAYLLEAAIAGYQTVSVTSASQALTYINGASNVVADNQSVYAMLRFTTTTGAAFNVYAPPASKQYIVWNDSGYSMTIYNSTTIGNTTAAGTGITITNGTKVMVWSDGTNFNELQAASITGTLAINKGGTGQVTANAAFNALAPAQTANRVLKSDGTNTSFAQVALTTDVTGTLPVANGGTGVTSSTGSGSNVLSTSPSLTTPILGTPTSGNLANCTFPTLNQNTTGTAAGLSSTLVVGSGGTGATTFSSGALLKGAGTSAITTASAADIVGQIGATAVTNATNATTAASCSGNAATATSPQSGGSFITSSNIASQSVNFANSATTAGNVSGTVAIGNGGTGQTSAASAGAALGAIGVGQSWAGTAIVSGTTYTNSTGRPIALSVSWFTGVSETNVSVQINVNGYTVSYSQVDRSTTARPVVAANGFAIVPAGHTYQVLLTGSGSLAASAALS